MEDSQVVEKRFELLRTEVALKFPKLIDGLERGLKMIILSEPYPDFDFSPDTLRIIGSMVMLCRHYGAFVLIAAQGTYSELNSKFNEDN